MENKKDNIEKFPNGNQPDANPETETVEVKKEGGFKKFVRTVTKPARWCFRKIKQSPAATAVGAVGGAGLALGGRVLIKKFLENRNGGDYQEEIEVEDTGETYVDSEEDQAV